jgi:LPXTG-site transpeptidase (sortase) family protein
MKSLLSRANETAKIVATYKFIFASFFLFVFVSTFIFLYLLNLVPDQLDDRDITQVQPIQGSTQTVATSTTTSATTKTGELPMRIVIDKIGVNSIVQNTSATDIGTLNSLLSHGVVRYAGSGYLGVGNLFLFGHSTSLKVVNNQAYKAFNNLKSLKSGDLITVYSDDKKYIYKVFNVALVNSENTVINLSVKEAKLTLSSCNTLGAKEERYVVEADYIGVEKI